MKLRIQGSLKSLIKSRKPKREEAGIFYRPGSEERAKVVPLNGKTFELAELYCLLNTDTVEVIDLPNGVDLMVVCENGKPRKLPVNEMASTMAAQEIVGPVLVMPKSLW